MEEKIMHLLITEDDMALAQGLQRALQKAFWKPLRNGWKICSLIHFPASPIPSTMPSQMPWATLPPASLILSPK